MKVLNYTQREEMKIYGSKYSALIDYSHWQRFIEPFVKAEVDFPNFLEYRNWIEEFPGWSYGKVDENHVIYSEGQHYPMNEYYEKLSC